MSIQIIFTCTGPEGGNGCPEGLHPLAEHADGSHASIKAGWERLNALIKRSGFIRSTRDQKYRCEQCHRKGPAAISGHSMDVWDRAFALWQGGTPGKDWFGKDGLPTRSQWNNAVHRIPEFKERLKDSPLYREIKNRANPLDEDMWERVADRFTAGEEKQDICTGKDGWPTPKQWNAKMGRDDDFRDLINGEHDSRRAAEEAKIDQAVELWENSDIRLNEALPTNGLRQRWHQRLMKSEPFRKRVYDAHLSKRNSAWSRAYSKELLARTIEFIAQGGKTTDLPGMPETLSQQGFHHRVGRDPIIAAAYDVALEQTGRTRKRGGFDMALDWDGVIEDVEWGDTFIQACEKPGRPTLSQWNYRRRKDSAFREAADLATGKRTRKRAKEKKVREAELQKKRELAKRPIGEILATQLAKNDLYSAVNRAVPVGLPTHIRDDVIGEMVMAVLEGSLAIDDVYGKAREYTSAYHRAYDTYKLRSMDGVIKGTDNLKLIDTFSNEDRLW